MFKKNKKKEEDREFKTGKPLSFYKKETAVTRTETNVEEGIAHFCCSRMKKACTEYKEKNTIYYSELYSKDKKIGCYTHNYENSGYDSYRTSYVDFEIFDFCPFCGVRINGYVEKEDSETL